MKILGINFKKQEAPAPVVEPIVETPTAKAFSFSTSFGTIGKGDLSKPYINTNYKGLNGMILFGKDNLFPQLSIQMVYSSPLTSDILRFQVNAATGGGFEIIDGATDAQGKVAQGVFIKANKIDESIETSARDYSIHAALYAIIHYKNGKAHKFEIIPSEQVRHNENKTLFMVNKDWSKNQGIEYIKALHPSCKDEKQMFCVCEKSPGQIYSLPTWTTAHNWAFLDGQIAFLQKTNIQESIYPSFSIQLPFIPASDEEKQSIQNTISEAKGANEAGRILLLAAPNKELMPVITALPTNANDKLFENTGKDIRDNICYAWGINPVIMGVNTGGGGLSIGDGEMKAAYSQWEKNIIMPLRKKVEYFYNELMDIFGITGEFKIKNYQIIGEEIVEVKEDEASKTIKALNTMEPSIAAKVLENLTQNEIRALAGLKPIEGGDAQANTNNFKKQ